MLSKREQSSRHSQRSKARQASRKTVRESTGLQWRPQYSWWLAAAGVVVLAAVLWPRDVVRPIGKIQLSGQLQHLERAEIEQRLKTYLGQGFFAIDLEQVQQHLQQQAWIEQVSVRRVWPNGLAVSLQEKRPYARWDDDHLLSVRGEVFRVPTEDFTELPVVTGYVDNSAELLQRFSTLRGELDGHGIHLTGLREDNKGALTLQLDGRLQVSLGSKDIERKLGHLLAVYRQQIHNRLEHIEHIDFRYSNGFAIAWKQEYLKQLSDSRNRGGNNV